MLTMIKVDVLGDLVPCAVVEVPDLLFVLHHARRLAFLPVLEGDVVLNGLEVLPVLREEVHVSMSAKQGSLPHGARFLR